MAAKAPKAKKVPKGKAYKFERIPAAEIETTLATRAKEGWTILYQRFNSGENDLAVTYTK